MEIVCRAPNQQVMRINAGYAPFAQEYRTERQRLVPTWDGTTQNGFIEVSQAWDNLTALERQPYQERGTFGYQPPQNPMPVIGHGIAAARANAARLGVVVGGGEVVTGEGRGDCVAAPLVVQQGHDRHERGRERTGGNISAASGLEGQNNFGFSRHVGRRHGVVHGGHGHDGQEAGRRGGEGRNFRQPRRPMSSFLMFCNDARSTIIERGNIQGRGGMGSALGHEWTRLDPITRQRYNALARMEMRRYQTEMNAFRRAQGEALRGRRGGQQSVNAAAGEGNNNANVQGGGE